MANRPVFVPRRSKTAFVAEIPIEFKWYAGLAVSQKQKSIMSLHNAARGRLPASRILEISSKSPEAIGVRLSAFNLSLPLDGRTVSVEVAFQSGKIFERGGPYFDLLEKPSREAKGDPRLRESGRLIGFNFGGETWPIEPRTAFYDWIYLQALKANPGLASQIASYEAFTDIEFNPEKSLNCQARSAALYLSLSQAGLLDEALASKGAYLRILGAGAGEVSQRDLF
jgi:hypothetical protein